MDSECLQHKLHNIKLQEEGVSVKALFGPPAAHDAHVEPAMLHREVGLHDVSKHEEERGEEVPFREDLELALAPDGRGDDAGLHPPKVDVHGQRSNEHRAHDHLIAHGLETILAKHGAQHKRVEADHGRSEAPHKTTVDPYLVHAGVAPADGDDRLRQALQHHASHDEHERGEGRRARRVRHVMHIIPITEEEHAEDVCEAHGHRDEPPEKLMKVAALHVHEDALDSVHRQPHARQRCVDRQAKHGRTTPPN